MANMTTVAINGMGVVGREILRLFFTKYTSFDVKLINDPNITAKNLAYLLQHDSVYHEYATSVNVSTYTDSKDRDIIEYNGYPILFTHEEDPYNIPLGDNHIFYTIECTGRAISASDLTKFFDAGSSRVIACYLLNDSTIPLIAYGVNHDRLSKDNSIIMLTDIGTQVAANLINAFGSDNIDTAMINNFAPYMNGQQLMDSENSQDFAFGRAGAWNISPLESSYTLKQIGKIIPVINGKALGMNYRSPTIDGGVCNVVMSVGNNPTVEDVNATIKGYKYADVLGYSDSPLVSSDALGYDAFQFLSGCTKAVSSKTNIVSLTAIYDSVRGQALQTIRTLEYIDSII